MNFQDMFTLVLFLKSLPKESFKTFLLPGDFGSEKYSGYWLANEAKINDLKLKVFGKAYLLKIEKVKEKALEDKIEAEEKEKDETTEKELNASEFTFQAPEGSSGLFKKGAGLA